jgi:hypothetical protein
VRYDTRKVCEMFKDCKILYKVCAHNQYGLIRVNDVILLSVCQTFHNVYYQKHLKAMLLSNTVHRNLPTIVRWQKDLKVEILQFIS